ncbi:malate synthase G [Geomicrobium sediminis]|uniref:Malate synthase G n=1 Tax=Geomicrobium sediminis TaxID=1347788 RepID=A0ABS2PI85_9BACL|nr:malate synthase G [Geomicrobium sediminis]MBM7634543.1 malate synthase [Geomicrobium sediminis]
MTYKVVGNIKIDDQLYRFVNEDVIPGTGITAEYFWQQYDLLLSEYQAENKSLLQERETLQQKINDWHKQKSGKEHSSEYVNFLKDIGYLEELTAPIEITTKNVDTEITNQAGPQLVVPVNNARYALNAANARFGSLYDALYGSDIISEENGATQGASYNPVRGEKVVDYAKSFLDQALPLQDGSHKDVTSYSISEQQIIATMASKQVPLKTPSQFVGFNGTEEDPSSLLFLNNNNHLELQIDRNHPIGKSDLSGLKDVILESAITTIIDCEDSVTAVDAEDKVLVYRNWLGLMKGTLETTFEKDGKSITRKLNNDRNYTSPNGASISLHGRSLLFIRNVGHLMTTDAILDEHDNETPEGIMDGMITSLIALHDLKKTNAFQNSRTGSIYIVKPKMHGSKEVAFTNSLFNRIEDILNLDRYTLKVGIMDEERRTSLNLKACIQAAKERTVFINTGFLDRTGDEIHTSMEAGAVIPKAAMKGSTWLNSYEKSNVQHGLNSGFQGKAQIGKGMWAMPNLMNAMIEQKGGQLRAGANTAWVPSPTAATLHAMHYHQIDVQSVQETLLDDHTDYLEDILQIPTTKETYSQEDIQQELNNNAQGILGYVVRWVEHGVGCSTVPDINDVGLMEDRATLRISSQHMCNWLYHGLTNEEQVMETMKRMAKVVDEQNADDPAYRNMAPNFEDSVAFQAACDLVFKGKEQPSGYTEPILHQRRKEAKQKLAVK